MPDLDYIRALELAEIGDAERRRWRVIKNPALPDFNWEVCRDDDSGHPVMVIGCRTADTAWNEHEEQTDAACVRAIIAAHAASTATRA